MGKEKDDHYKKPLEKRGSKGKEEESDEIEQYYRINKGTLRIYVRLGRATGRKIPGNDRELFGGGRPG